MNRPTPRAALAAMLLCAALPALAQAPAAAPVAAPLAAPGGSRPAEDRDQLERRLASVTLLLDKSSAARQIDASGNAQAIAMRDSARALHRQAEQAFAAGKLAAATGALDQAARMMFDAVRLAAPEQVNGAKQQRDFDNLMESVTALLAAQQRIATEKKLGAVAVQAHAALEGQARAAAALAAGGKLDKARVALDQVYLTVKLSIDAMRGGDTLVRSLKFASKEEEFRYEIDRNDTHKMLLKLLTEEKRAANAALDGMVQKNIEQAARLRAEADAQAAKKDYEGAIKLLEDATKELVRAIRGAGVYIPG